MKYLESGEGEQTIQYMCQNKLIKIVHKINDEIKRTIVYEYLPSGELLRCMEMVKGQPSHERIYTYRKGELTRIDHIHGKLRYSENMISPKYILKVDENYFIYRLADLIEVKNQAEDLSALYPDGGVFNRKIGKLLPEGIRILVDTEDYQNLLRSKEYVIGIRLRNSYLTSQGEDVYELIRTV